MASLLSLLIFPVMVAGFVVALISRHNQQLRKKADALAAELESLAGWIGVSLPPTLPAPRDRRGKPKQQSLAVLLEELYGGVDLLLAHSGVDVQGPVRRRRDRFQALRHIEALLRQVRDHEDAEAPAPEGPLKTCRECRRVMPQSDMVCFSDDWLCPACKQLHVQRIREGADAGEGA